MEVTKKKVLFVAALCGLIVGLLVVSFVNHTQVDRESITVVVAKSPIPNGSVINASMLKTRRCAKLSLPSAFVLAQDQNSVASKIALADFRPGQPLDWTLVVKKDISFGLAYAIPSGMRAISIGVDAATGVSGFPKPGNRVDLIASRQIGGIVKSKILIQNVGLLAVGSQIQPGKRETGASLTGSQPATVTVLATPQQAQAITLAILQGGKITLALRGVGDLARVPEVVVSNDTRPSVVTIAREQQVSMPIRKVATPKPLDFGRMAPEPAKVIEIIRGSQKEFTPVSQ